MAVNAPRPADMTYNAAFWKQAFDKERGGYNNVRTNLAVYRDTQPILEDRLLATFPRRKQREMRANRDRKWHHRKHRELPPEMPATVGPKGMPDMTMYQTQPVEEYKPGQVGVMPDKLRGTSMLWPTRFLKSRATHSWRTYDGNVNQVRTQNRFQTSNQVDYNATNALGAYVGGPRRNSRYPMPANVQLLTQFGDEPVALPGDRPTKRCFKKLPRLMNKLAGPAAS